MSIRFSLLALVMAGVVGCGQTKQDPAATEGSDKPAAAKKSDYNPHDVPITEEQKAEMRKQGAKFPDAVAMIKELRNATEAETKNGIPQNPYKAHQALDKADLLLQWLPGIARDSGVPKDRWETINTTSLQLRESFEKVHQNIDNQKNPDFAAVAKAVDEGIGRLEAIAQAKP